MREHLERKNVARQQQQNYKLNKDITICTFDLQQVMTVPKLQVGQTYFLQKLNNMNLTIYDMSSDQGYCFLWDEVNGQKGTNEVFTSVCKWLIKIESQSTTVETVVLWSGSTGAQNRNKYMCTGLINYLASATHINTIEHKFLKAGHIFMEVDSINFAVERTTRHRELHSLSDIDSYIRSAKKNRNKYKTVRLVATCSFNSNCICRNFTNAS